MTFETDTSHPHASSAFEDTMALIRLALDPKAMQAALDGYIAAGVKARDLEASAKRAVTAMQAREAELDRREEAIRQREVELHNKSQRVKGQRSELSDHARHLGEVEDQIKMRLLRHAGALQHFNPLIQQLPSWAAVDRELGFGSGDPHFDGNEAKTARDEAGENEIPPDYSGSTLTRRSPRPPRPVNRDMSA